MRVGDPEGERIIAAKKSELVRQCLIGDRRQRPHKTIRFSVGGVTHPFAGRGMQETWEDRKVTKRKINGNEKAERGSARLEQAVLWRDT